MSDGCEQVGRKDGVMVEEEKKKSKGLDLKIDV